MVGIGADRAARQGGHVTSQVFVNLTTRDLARSQTFYEALGCTINPQFSDENAICVIWSDEIYFMMLLPEFFDSFGGKPIADPAQFTQVRTAFSRDSKYAVDAIVDAALAHGGALTGETQDLGSCTAARSKTRMATFSSSSTWTWRLRRRGWKRRRRAARGERQRAPGTLPGTAFSA